MPVSLTLADPLWVAPTLNNKDVRDTMTFQDISQKVVSTVIKKGKKAQTSGRRKRNESG